MPRFFVSPSQISADTVCITGEDVVHITRVLRMKAGDPLEICDGCGNDYDAVIQSVGKAQVVSKIIGKQRSEAESGTEVILFQALPKQGKMEYIIQKNTELGVAKIVPVYTKRCVTKPTDKSARWQKVSLEAAKQSGRGIVPQVLETVTFNEAVMRMKDLEAAIMLYECEDTTKLHDVLGGKRFGQIGLLIGSEGGFEPAEADFARQNGIPTVSLGKRILRTETAGAAVTAVVMYAMGEF